MLPKIGPRSTTTTCMAPQSRGARPMASERILLDTVYIEGLLNRSDQHHRAAVAVLPRIEGAEEVFITEAVAIEVCNALAKIDRRAAVQFVQGCHSNPKVTLVPVDSGLFSRGLKLYDERPDKTWSLTDCISFVVMHEFEIIYAATGDHHFHQAGFVPLLLEPGEL